MSVTQQEKLELLELFNMEEESNFSKAITLMLFIYGTALILFLR